jgi:hypothetical protein
VLLEQIQTVLHQLVVIGFFAGGATQFGDAGALREFDPDFRDKDTFEVETDELHGGTPDYVGWMGESAILAKSS